ncbi:galactosyltransferase-related protein [Thiohalocapsa sp.]|uniref:galactosyltransferase-related protein n=1 Tax=Thiohalocapsa sp. TaxID=2497641 RepID=UPI0026009499|nr:galactosyltransferase-related protein [Thiohalocapsa sp.]
MINEAKFWKRFSHARELFESGDNGACLSLLRSLHAECMGSDKRSAKRRDILSRLAHLASGANEVEPVAGGFPYLRRGSKLAARITEQPALPGVSLVTCSMNRAENLLVALRSWLELPEVREIVVVDWSSELPVSQSLAIAGIADERIKLLRVDGERRWVLSPAFNVGFRAATRERVVKADADIVIASNFFRANPLRPGAFYAGNWRVAPEGQEFVNGLFYIYKRDLAVVGGFNEYITSYGWDDEDLYARLIDTGLIRMDIQLSTVNHIRHDDQLRVEACGEATASEAAAVADGFSGLASQPQFLIRSNRFIANIMPPWSSRQEHLPFRILEKRDEVVRLARSGPAVHCVPPRVRDDAARYAYLEVLSWSIGSVALYLEDDHITILGNKAMQDLTALDAEVVMHGGSVAHMRNGYLVVDCCGDIDNATEDAARGALAWYLNAAATHGRELVVQAPSDSCWARLASSRGLAVIPCTCCLDELPHVDHAMLSAGLSQYRQTDPVVTNAGCECAHPVTMRSDSRPKDARIKPKLYIDAQHGLGNRLRAIASAAVIAEKSGRELVVVWRPDVHCQCTVSDLFEFDGSVTDSFSLSQAEELGMPIYNYMEIEPNSEKNRVIDPGVPRDIYVRSAYVLNCPLTSWADENEYLRRLTPVAGVRELVARVRHPNDVSLHVRMEGAPGTDHQAYDSRDNWSASDHETIQKWRSASHYERFMTRLDALIAEGVAQHVFVAADMPKTYEVFRERYPDRVAFLPRSRFDRSAEQLQYALADAILLGRSRILLGSNWSSFSELAMRLAEESPRVELSGKDF